MDAEKAFDKMGPRFLLGTMRTMKFGHNFLRFIRTLFSSPRSQVLTNGVLLDAFSLTHGSRQGCPSLPVLFSIAIESLATALRSDASITSIKIGSMGHKLNLYADDLLVFISQATISFPSLITNLKKYSDVSSYKINYLKSEAFLINMINHNISTLSVTFKWCRESFKCLGIHMCNTHEKIFEQNYISLLMKSKRELNRWMNLSLLLIGRINTIKNIFLFFITPYTTKGSCFIFQGIR